MSRTDPTTLDSLLAHTGWVRGLAMRLAKNGPDASDLEQEAWLRMLRAPPRHAAGRRSWIKVVLANAMRDTWRSESRRQHRERATATTRHAEPTADVVAQAELQHLVASAVLHLPDPYRAVVLLRYYEGLPARSIAARLEMPVETVHTQLKRARERLRRVLTKYQQTERGGIVAGAGGFASTLSAGTTKGALLVSASTKKWVVLAVIVLVAFCGAVVVSSLIHDEGTSPGPLGLARGKGPTLAANAERPAEEPAPAPGERLMRFAPLTVRVTRAGQLPVVGATVRAYRHGAHQRSSWMRLRASYAERVAEQLQRTDAGGEARFEALRVGGWTVVASSPGMAPSGVELPRLSDGGGERVIELRLVAAGRVAGRVLDAMGKPVTGALLLAYRATPGREGAVQARAVSGADGRYGFTSLPRGLLSLDVRAPRHAVHRTVPSRFIRST